MVVTEASGGVSRSRDSDGGGGVSGGCGGTGNDIGKTMGQVNKKSYVYTKLLHQRSQQHNS